MGGGGAMLTAAAATWGTEVTKIFSPPKQTTLSPLPPEPRTVNTRRWLVAYWSFHRRWIQHPRPAWERERERIPPHTGVDPTAPLATYHRRGHPLTLLRSVLSVLRTVTRNRHRHPIRATTDPVRNSSTVTPGCERKTREDRIYLASLTLLTQRRSKLNLIIFFPSPQCIWIKL